MKASRSFAKRFPCWQQVLAKIPLRMLLTVPFILQLLAAVGLVGYLSFQNGQRAVSQLADQLMNQVAVRINDRLDAYLQTPQQVVELDRMALETGELNLENFDELETHFFRQVQVFQSLTTLGFGNVQGETIGAGRDRSGVVTTPDSLVSWEARGTAPNTRYFYAMDSQGKRLKAIHVTPNFDARQRGWYKAAMNAGRQTWSPVFPVLNLPIAAVSAVTPIYQNSELKGVLTSEVLLSDINLFLHSLNFSRSGQAFIIERSGDLVATSTQEQPFVKNVKGEQLIRLRAIDSKDPVTRATMQTLMERQSLDQLQAEQLSFPLNQQRQFIQVVPYHNDYGLDWLIVTAIPESDFMAEIQRNQRQTWLLCGLTLLLATATGIVTARWIATPLRRLQQAAQAVTQGDLSFPVQTGGIGEVAQLTTSFQQMAQQLHTSFRSLQASEQKFLTLLNHVPIGISVFDATGSQILINQVGETILGQEFVPGITLDRISEVYRVYVAGTDQLYPIDQLPAMRALRGESVSVEDIEIANNHHRIPLAVQTIPILDEAGTVIYAINMFQDITERLESEQLRKNYQHELERQVIEQTQAWRDSEERFRSAFDDAPIGMALVALNGQFLKVNRALCEIVGYPEAELLSHTFQDITYSDDLDVSLEAMQNLLTNDARSYQLEKRYQHQQGHPIQCLLHVSLVKNVNQQPLYFIAQIQDMSERYAIDRMKNEFISVVSHELRTPLTAIRGSLGLLNSGFYSDKLGTAKDLLQIALNNSERLVRLINDILDLERLESGKVKLVKETCDVTSLMQQAIESVQMLADQFDIQIVMHPLPIQMQAAPDAIVQTLTNLLSNAIKFSPEGSTVRLRAAVGERQMKQMRKIGAQERADSPTTPPPHHPLPTILFSVQDQGQGIPADKLTAVFDRFQQVNVSDSREKGGTGLGLAICKSIVEKHGGQIWVESILGQGSIFYFTLPLTNPTL